MKHSLASCAALLAALALPAQAVSLRVEISDPIQVDDQFEVSLFADDLFDDHAGHDFIAYGFDLVWNTAIASLATWNIASGFDVLPAPVPSAPGSLTIAASTFPALFDPGIPVDLLLAQVRFEALAVGPFALNVASDGFLSGLFYSDANGPPPDPAVFNTTYQTTISPTGQIPLPGTLILLAAGLPFLLRRR